MYLIVVEILWSCRLEQGKNEWNVPCIETYGASLAGITLHSRLWFWLTALTSIELTSSRILTRDETAHSGTWNWAIFNCVLADNRYSGPAKVKIPALKHLASLSIQSISCEDVNKPSKSKINGVFWRFYEISLKVKCFLCHFVGLDNLKCNFLWPFSWYYMSHGCLSTRTKILRPVSSLILTGNKWTRKTS